MPLSCGDARAESDRDSTEREPVREVPVRLRKIQIGQCLTLELVDRSDRRRLIVTTQPWRAVVMAMLAVVILADVVQMWQLFIVEFVTTAGEILVDPSAVATVPRLVKPSSTARPIGRVRPECAARGRDINHCRPRRRFMRDGGRQLHGDCRREAAHRGEPQRGGVERDRPRRSFTGVESVTISSLSPPVLPKSVDRRLPTVAG